MKYPKLFSCFSPASCFVIPVTCCIFFFVSCKQVELYQRLENIPGAAWKGDYKPTFTFNITDTASLYDVYITVRHTNSYGHNNIWIESALQLPGDSLITQKLDLTLASPEGWMGIGMDDIFERSIKVTTTPQQFKKSGSISFTLSQAMRQDPLPGIMQVGVRVEKAN